MKRTARWLAPLGIAAAFILVLAPMVYANGLQVPFHLGRMWTNPEDDGDASDVMQFPAGIPIEGKFGDATTGNLARGWVGIEKKGGTYLFAIDWTDPNETLWPDAGSYFYRSMNYDYPEKYLDNGNFDYLFPVDRQEYMRWERPRVITQVKSSTGEDSLVDFMFHPGSEGLDVFTYPSSSGRGPRPAVAVDPDLITEQVLMNKWRYIPGVDLVRHTYGYGFGSPHQDYIVHDMTLTNTGKTGRMLDELPTPAADADVLTNQTLSKVLWARSHDFRTQAAGGNQKGKDEALEYIKPWDDAHYFAYTYDTDDEDVDGADWGDPATSEYYENHMLGTGYGLVGALFTSAGPGTDFDTDDLEQPAFRTCWYERGFDMKGEAPYVNAGEVEAQRSFLTDGSIHLPDNTNYEDFINTAAIADDGAGPTAIIGYGPLGGERTEENIDLHGWDLGWEESVRIVQMLAASGIDRETGRAIGEKWNTARTAEQDPSTWMSAEDIALVQTGEDSVLKAAALAIWNYTGSFPAAVTQADLDSWGIGDMLTSKPAEYSEPYDAPDGPRPPDFIGVRARTDVENGGIEIRWGTSPETDPDVDTGVLDFARYRVYRQAGSRLAVWEVIAEGPASYFAEAEALGDIPAGRYLIDGDVVAGKDYWYCVTAIDDGSQNWARPGKALESTRWWTWTGYSHIGVTATLYTGDVAVGDAATPGKFALSQNVPNPFNPTTTISFSIPEAGEATLAIYNMTGQLVRTLVDGSVEVGAHQVTWDGLDNNGRTVASGVYVYRLTNGERTMHKRMTLVK